MSNRAAIIFTTAQGLRRTLGISIGSISNFSGSGNMTRPVSLMVFFRPRQSRQAKLAGLHLLSTEAMVGQFTESTTKPVITLKVASNRPLPDHPELPIPGPILAQRSLS